MLNFLKILKNQTYDQLCTISVSVLCYGYFCWLSGTMPLLKMNARYYYMLFYVDIVYKNIGTCIFVNI